MLSFVLLSLGANAKLTQYGESNGLKDLMDEINAAQEVEGRFDDLKCTLCEKIVARGQIKVEDICNDPSQACADVPDQLEDKCEDLVKLVCGMLPNEAPDQICEQLQFCGSADDDGDVKCTLCEKEVQKVIDQYEPKVEAFCEQLCEKLPEELQPTCDNIAEQICGEDIQKEVTAEKVCTFMKLCSNDEHPAPCPDDAPGR